MRIRESAGWFGRGRVRDCGLAVHVLGILGLAILSLLLVSAPVADASPTSFTWTGQSTITENWSAPANWEGGAAPTSGEEIETLTFPQLTSPACINEPSSHPCYFSFNDVNGLSAKAMQIDDGDDYLIGGDAITIGSGGLNASPAAGATGSAGDVVETPLHLGASQTWNIAGRSGGELGENGLFLAGNLTGSGDALTIELSNGPLLFLAENDTEIGPLTIDGADTSKVAANGIVSIFGGKLNFSDGEPVSLSHVFFAGSGAVGPLTTSDADIDVGSPAAGMEVMSATLDSASYVAFNVTGAGMVAQSEYSQLISHGSIELADSNIEVVVSPKENKPCPTLTAGRTYTFVSTTGSLSGTFANAPEGGPEIPIRFSKSCAQRSQKLRIAYHESGGTQTVTGTVEAEANEAQEQEAKEYEETSRKHVAEHAKKVAEEEAAATEAATKRKHEEEAVTAATKKRQEEEAAATKNEAEVQATGSVSLIGSTLTARSGKAAVRLLCTGTVTCDGKLTLTGKSTPKKGKKARMETIGTVIFSIPAGKTTTVELKLNGTGRSLLAAAHGRLSVTLTILKFFPAPSQTHTTHVRLVQQKAGRKAKA